MPEAASTFNQTVRERNELKRSAAHKKNGSAVPKLGNKVMSWQEIASKHGECKCYDLKSFMSYETFQNVPADLQIEYINDLCDKYDVGIKHLSRYLFELSDDDLRDYLRERGILNQCNPQKARSKFGLKLMTFDIEDWKRKEHILEAIDNMVKEEQFSEFITYEDFKQLEANKRLEYINHLIDKYHVGHNTISVILFDKSPEAIGYFARRDNTLNNIIKPDRNGVKLSECKKRFKDAVDEWKAGLAQYEPKQEPMEETEVIPKPVENLIDKESMEAEDILRRKATQKHHKDHIDTRPKLEEAPKMYISIESPYPVEEIAAAVETATQDTIIEPEVKEELQANEICEPVEEDARDICDPNDFWHSIEPIPEPEKDPMEYHDFSFESNYVREGIDMDELFTISRLVQNKKVRVKFSVTVI